VDIALFPYNRFERLRRVIDGQERFRKNIEFEVLSSFEKGDLAHIEQLMKQKNQIVHMNYRLYEFILKWERIDSESTSHPFFTSV
jgi:hypothetical protein